MGKSNDVRGRKYSSQRPSAKPKLEDTCRELWLAWRLARKPSLRAGFDDTTEASDVKRPRVEPGLGDNGRSRDDPDGNAAEQPKVKEVWDPWAEDEPIFGHQQRRHALSSHPGTPPCGNLAVQDPTLEDGSAPSEPDAASKASDVGGASAALPSGLVTLERPLRVELQIGFSERWTLGLVERVSRTGFEMSISGRPGGECELIVAGRRAKVLVTPRGEAALVLSARVLWVDPSPDNDGPRRAQLALATSDPTVLGWWAEVVEKARG